MKNKKKKGTPQSLKILLLGDIVARPGRRAVEIVLPQLIKELEIDLVIANAENLAGGRGVTAKTIEEMLNAGVDYFTSGHHIFSHEESMATLEEYSNLLIRPFNYLDAPKDLVNPNDEGQFPGIPGRGFIRFERNGYHFVLLNLEGTTNMPLPVSNPFLAANQFLANEVKDDEFVIVDFHAEVSSEKSALAFYLDGKVNIIFGTHTHVPTADLQVLPKGTFFVSDLGMQGSKNSVLGVQKDIIIRRFIKPTHERFMWEYQGEKVFSSVLVEINNDKKITGFHREDRVIP